MQPQAAPPAQLLSPRWIAFAALALAIPLGALILSRPEKRRLPVLVELPGFALTDHLGRPFGRKDMLGRVWIANFIFTSCAEACPRLTQKVRRIQDRLTLQEAGGTIGLLSLSVDPERDTPARLKQYAETYGAKDPVWRFLTGPQAEIERTIVKGFRIAMAKVPLPPDDPKRAHEEAFDIVHGEQLVLVDVQGRIRGYYVADEKGTERLLRDARLLATGGA